MTLTDHLEDHLGKVAGGWSQDQSGSALPFQVLIFEDAPIAGCLTYSTLGVSSQLLDQGDGSHIRQELLFACYDRFRFWDPQNLLAGMGLDLFESGHALHRGRVAQLPGLLFERTDLQAIYCAVPVYFPRSLHMFSITSPPTVFVWLLPLTSSEATLIEEKGWSAFESMLAEEDPDLFDLNRRSIVK